MQATKLLRPMIPFALTGEGRKAHREEFHAAAFPMRRSGGVAEGWVTANPSRQWWWGWWRQEKLIMGILLKQKKRLQHRKPRGLQRSLW